MRGFGPPDPSCTSDSTPSVRDVVVSSPTLESATPLAANSIRRRSFSRGRPEYGGRPLTPSDAELLAQAARGLDHAYPACIDRFGPLVWTLARQILANRTDAEDAVQEIFAELWRVAERFDPAIASARSFVSTIARRRLIDRGRARQRLNREVQGALAEDLPVATAVQPIDRLARDERDRVAMEEFGKLRVEQQRVIRLAIHEEWTHERIAEHLSIPVGTVKTHLRRGLLRLRETLGSRDAGDPTSRDVRSGEEDAS